MKKAKLYLVACSLIIWGVCLKKIYASPGFSDSRYLISRQVQYSFTLQNKSNHLLKKAEFWTYAPVKQNSTQLCVGLEASYPYKLIIDEQGNQIFHFTFHDLPPYATKVIVIKANLKFSDKPTSIPIKDLTFYLQEGEYIELGSPEISLIAKKFKTLKPSIQIAKNIFDWIVNNIKYTGYFKNDRGALYALRKRQGDCTEFMYLFIALCRAKKIPARGIGGYIYKENNILKPSDYHNWAEFYDNGTWKVADPQKKVFRKNQSNYIAMRIIGESPRNPMGKSHKFRFSGDELSVRMNEIQISNL